MVSKLPKEYLSLLDKYISFESISTDTQFRPEIEKAHKWLITLFKKEGFKTKLLPNKNDSPVVYAEYMHNKKALSAGQAGGRQEKTILIYGHYDVQPANKAKWDSNPFKLRITKDKLIARGSTDNKGQLMIHIYTILKLIRENKLKYNVKFFIEGGEESGSPGIKEILQKNKKLLASDLILISDGEMKSGFPTVDVAFRGLINFTVTYKTSSTDLHSGTFGGAVPNAAYELSELLSKLYDKDNKVVVPGFYENVDKINTKNKSINKKLSPEKHHIKNARVHSLLCEKGYDFYTQTGMRPTIQITGIDSGYTGEGEATIVPGEAIAKLSIRIVPSQNPQKIFKSVEKFIKNNTPKHVSCTISKVTMCDPVKLNHDQKSLQNIKRILKDVYKKEVIENYVGGSLPIMALFKYIIGRNPISVSLANEDCNMHGINENIKVTNIKKGLEFSEKFFGK